jgi:protein SCO1/2
VRLRHRRARKSRPRGIVLFGRALRCALAAGLVVGLGGCPGANEAPNSELVQAAAIREVRGKTSDRFSNVELTTQHGERVRFYDDLVRDKVVMINFMYTTCPLICPGMAARLSRFSDLLGERAGRDITILSISIDPEVDTPEKLDTYWKAFGSKPGWIFLTGDYDAIDRLRHELGVYDPDPIIDADKTQHAGIVTFGNDRTDRWAALPLLTDLQDLARTVRRFTWDEQWVGKPDEIAVSERSRARSAHGIVRELRPEHGEAVIEHGDIPGLMPGMTMAFQMTEPALFAGLHTGQLVDFDLKGDPQGRYQIVKISARSE